MPGRPLILEVVIENPLGSRVRMRFDPEQGWVGIGLPFPRPLPAEYGYLPHTCNPADGEPVDVIVLGYGPTFPGCHYFVRPIGLFLRSDGDHKVLAVPHTPDVISPLQEIAEVEPGLACQIEEWIRLAGEVVGRHDARHAREWIERCYLSDGGDNVRSA